jgi:hypothetical protein
MASGQLSSSPVVAARVPPRGTKAQRKERPWDALTKGLMHADAQRLEMAFFQSVPQTLDNRALAA